MIAREREREREGATGVINIPESSEFLTHAATARCDHAPVTGSAKSGDAVRPVQQGCLLYSVVTGNVLALEGFIVLFMMSQQINDYLDGFSSPCLCSMRLPPLRLKHVSTRVTCSSS